MEQTKTNNNTRVEDNSKLKKNKEGKEQKEKAKGIWKKKIKETNKKPEFHSKGGLWRCRPQWTWWCFNGGSE